MTAQIQIYMFIAHQDPSRLAVSGQCLGLGHFVHKFMHKWIHKIKSTKINIELILNGCWESICFQRNKFTAKNSFASSVFFSFLNLYAYIADN